MTNSSILVLVTILTIWAVGFGSGQEFSSLNDKAYLDTIQAELEENVEEAKVELIEQAKVVQEVTKNYAAARLSGNLFKALRVLAEKELDAIPMKSRIRQPRQEAEEESSGGGDDEEAAVASATENSPAVSGFIQSQNTSESLIPVLAGILKSVFGGDNGTKPLNVTHTLLTASKIITHPFQRPLNGISNLLQRFRPTQAPIKYYPVPVYAAPAGPFPEVIDPAVRVTRYPITEAPTTTTARTRRTTTKILRLVGREEEAAEGRVKRDDSASGPGPVPTRYGAPAYVRQAQVVDPIPVYAPAYAPNYPGVRGPVPVSPINVPEPIPVYAPAYGPNYPGVRGPAPVSPINVPEPRPLPVELPISVPVRTPSVPAPKPAAIAVSEPVPAPKPAALLPIYSPNPSFSSYAEPVPVPVSTRRPARVPVFSPNPEPVPGPARAPKPATPAPPAYRPSFPSASKPEPSPVISQNPPSATPTRSPSLPVYAPSYSPILVHSPSRPAGSTLVASQVFAEPPAASLPDPPQAQQPEPPAKVPAVPVPAPTTPTAPTAVVVKVKESVTTEPTTTPGPGVINIEVISRDIQQGLDGIIKNLPDILKGVKEGLGLIQNIADIFGEVDT